MAVTSSIVGNGDSAGEPNARSRDGMTSASNETGSFSPRRLSLDLEVGVGDRRIHVLVHRYDDKPDAGLLCLRRFPLFLNDSQPSVQGHK